MSELQKENRRLQAKVHSLNNVNDILQRKLFEYDEMHNRLITSLGVSNIVEAMDSIIAKQRNSSNESLNERERIIQLEDALATQLDAVKAAEISIHSISAELYQTRQELAQAMEDLERLRHERYTARKEAEKYATDAQTWRMELETKLPEMQNMLRSIKQTCPEEEEPSVAENLVVLSESSHGASVSDSSVRGELERLKVQYQALLASKQKITERYKEDLVKWKRFKTWAVKGGPIDHKLIIRRKRSHRGVRPDENENILDPFVINHTVPVASSSIEESLTQPSDFPSSQTIHGILPSPVSRKKSPTSSSSVVSDDANEVRETRFNQSPNLFITPGLTGDNSHPHKQGLAYSGSDDGSPQGELRSKVVQGSSSPLNESVSDVILVPDTPPTQMPSVLRDRRYSTLRKGKQALAERSNSEEDNPVMTSASKIIPFSDKSANKSVNYSHRNLSQYMQFKGRGRYSNVQQPCTTINSVLESNYIHEPSKKKDERKTLKGSECECCREYYETLRPLPAGLAPPLWRSPSVETSPKRKCLHQSTERRTRDDIEDHKNEVSRHRSHSGPTTTPPNFWKIGFPNTQEIEDINRKAENMHARKYQRMEKDSKLNNGNYRRRA